MSASLTRRWKKWMAVGCSHGHLACPKALRTVLKFKSEFRPDKTLHLGDYVDLAALRGGAHGTKDEAADIDHDLKCGTNFVEELEPDILFDGNHEDRLERMCDHPKAIVSYCAGKIVGEINDFCRRGKIERVPYGIHVGWRRLGDHLFGHGYMFSEAAIKDHSESIGNCVIAHLHRSGMERAPPARWRHRLLRRVPRRYPSHGLRQDQALHPQMEPRLRLGRILRRGHSGPERDNREPDQARRQWRLAPAMSK